MNKSLMVVLAAFASCLVTSWSVVFGQTTTEQHQSSIVAAVTVPGSAVVIPPKLADVYVGRWSIDNPSGAPFSGATLFRVEVQFQPDLKYRNGDYWLATGTYTTIPSDPNRICGLHENIPMELRWKPGQEVYYLWAKPVNKACPDRKFVLIRNSEGHFKFKSEDGKQTAFFAPQNDG